MGSFYAPFMAFLNGPVLGSSSTVRYWDLRYSFDQTILNSYNPPILPDYIGVTGGYASNHFLESGFAKSILVDIEALRYQHLDPSNISKNTNKTRSVLFVGDISISSTNRLLKIAHCAELLPNLFDHIYFKCHPCLDPSQFLCPMIPRDVGGPELLISCQKLT